MKKNNKLKIILPITFLIFIIIIGSFPNLFTNIDPSEHRIALTPPNNGDNTISIENKSDEIIKIDSLIFLYENYTEKINKSNALVEKITVLPKGKSVFHFNLNRSNYKIEHCKLIVFKLFTRGEFCKETNYISINFNSIKNYKLEKEASKNEYTKRVRFNNIKKDKIFKEKSIFGTDNQGRDIWSRFVFGTGIILKIILFSILISVPVGVISGLLRGYFSHQTNGKFFISILANLLEAIVWLANSAPIYLLAMLIVSILGHKLMNIVIAFSLVQWVEIDKLIYEKVSYLKKQDFIVSAKMFGKTDMNIIFSELLSLCFPQIIIGAIFLMSRIVLIESSLSFLGYSVSVPYSSWGSILAGIEVNNQIYSITKVWWIVLLPTFAIMLTIFSLNTIRNYLNETIW